MRTEDDKVRNYGEVIAEPKEPYIVMPHFVTSMPLVRI